MSRHSFPAKVPVGPSAPHVARRCSVWWDWGARTYRALIQELPAGAQPLPSADRGWNTAPVIHQAESPALTDLAKRVRWFADIPEPIQEALRGDALASSPSRLL